MLRRTETSPLAIIVSFWCNRQLIWLMIKRDVVGYYHGSVIGFAWSLISPILILSVYTFVFSVVFKARWGDSGEESRVDFAIILFVGMIVHGLFASCINSAPSLIINNINFVKKTVFPLEILPWVMIGSALFQTAMSILVLLAFFAVLNFYLNWTIIFLPLIFFPLSLVTIGLVWFLAATGVFLRDLRQITGIFTTILLFLSPVFYPISALPKEYQNLLNVNPLTFIIEETRAVLIWGKMPNYIGLGWYSVASVLVAWAGFYLFQKMRKGFADVL